MRIKCNKSDSCIPCKRPSERSTNSIVNALCTQTQLCPLPTPL